MKNNQYSVEVLIHGKPASEYNHYINGEYKTFIEGRQGTEYALKITNYTNQKLLAIASVDGLSVVSGKKTDGYRGRGYIIQPYGNVTIKGFRESDNSVGSFMFTNKEGSYASEQGGEKNSGIIAVNLIDEKVSYQIINSSQPYPPYDPWSPKKNTKGWPDITCDKIYNGTSADTSNVTFTASTSNVSTTNFMCATPIAGGQTKAANFDLGSTFGKRIEDKITHKAFEKGNIVSQFKIYYASRSALESIGIKFYQEKQINEWPEPFNQEYCQPPHNWKG